MTKEKISQEDINNAREKKKNMKKGATRWSIYGANYLSGVLGKNIETVNYNDAGIPSSEGFAPDLGNPYAALGLAALDTCAKTIPEFYNSPAYGLAKSGAGAFFFGKTVYDLASVITGDFDQLAEIPFDASMAYQEIRDMAERYKSGTKPRRKKFLEEVVEFGNMFKGKKGSQNSNPGNTQYQTQSQGTNYQASQSGQTGNQKKTK